MSQAPEQLIESDRIEEVLDQAGPPPPVVVVQYRKPVMPWILVAALISIALTLGGMLARNRRQVERFREQILEARSDVERLREQAQAPNSRPQPPADRPAPPRSPHASLTEQPKTPGPAAAEKAASSPTPDPALATVQLPAPADPVKAARRASTATAAAACPRAAAVDRTEAPDRHPGVGPRGSVAVGREAGPRGRRPGREPGGACRPASRAAFALARGDRATDPGGGRSDATGDRPAAEPAAGGPPDAPRRRTPPVPRRLRVTLKVHGRKAGPEIEELSIRAGRDEDPVKLRQAYRVIGSGRQSQGMKVYHLRELGVSESVILDYLANELNHDLGARNGPRSKNEVWIQAAQRLLSYPLPPPRPGDVPPAPVRPAKRPVAAPRPAGGCEPRTLMMSDVSDNPFPMDDRSIRGFPDENQVGGARPGPGARLRRHDSQPGGRQAPVDPRGHAAARRGRSTRRQGAVHRRRHPLQARVREHPPEPAQDPLPARGEARRHQAREPQGAACSRTSRRT